MRRPDATGKRGARALTDWDIVYVVLVYRNAGDLSDFLRSLSQNCPLRYRVVVVNSFCGETYRAETERISRESGCDFLNVENRGYGAGNNAGIAYARARYRFRWLAVCNPDTVLRRMPPDPACGAGGVCGPDIRTRTGKRQNPCMPLPGPVREKLLRRYAVGGGRAGFWGAVAINKAERILFLWRYARSRHRVYALHGSFLVFSAAALEKLGEPFDPRMFLFREEDHLARRCRQLGIPMLYDPRIQVFHKEDGSLRLSDANVEARTMESLRVYFGLGRTEK